MGSSILCLFSLGYAKANEFLIVYQQGKVTHRFNFVGSNSIYTGTFFDLNTVKSVLFFIFIFTKDTISSITIYIIELLSFFT